MCVCVYTCSVFAIALNVSHLLPLPLTLLPATHVLNVKKGAKRGGATIIPAW